MLTLPSGLQWRTTRMGTHTDQYLQWDRHHHLSAKFCVIHTPIGPKQGAASLSCSNKKWTTSGRLSPNVNIQNGLWTKWRKDLTGIPERWLMGLIAKALLVPKLSPEKLKPRATLSYPTHKVCVKVSKISVVDMASKLTSNVAVPSRTPDLPQGQRPYGQPKWYHILVPMWWPRLWWWTHRGNLQDLWWKIQRAPKGPLTHSSTQQPNRPPHQSQQLLNNREGGAQFS